MLSNASRALHHRSGRGLKAGWAQCQARRANSTLAPNHPHHDARKVPPSADDAPERPPFDHSRPVRYTHPPNPEWELGQKVQDLKEDSDVQRRRWDMETLPPRDIYRLMTSAIVPRPIAFVSTLSGDEVPIPNLAPFSYFSMISHNPPLLSVSFNISKRRPKDTRENILATRQFTVNIIDETIVEPANATSVESPARMDEWILSGLSPEPSTLVKPPLVQESSVGFECELYSFQDICAPGSSRITATLVLGLIKRMHVRESVLNEAGDAIDPAKLRPVSRLGGVRYARVTDVFELPRIDWNNLGDTYNGLLG